MAEELKLDVTTTALVLIDLQRGIVGRDTRPYPTADVVAKSAQLAEAVRDAAGTVVYVHVLVNEIHRPAADRAVPRPAEPLPATAWEIVPEAGKQPGDIEIAKRTWGAFTGTSLDQQLRRKGIRTLVMAGVATNIGVESTARAALELGYELVFAEDAMTSLSDDMHRFATETIFPIMGKVRSSEEIIAALR